MAYFCQHFSTKLRKNSILKGTINAPTLSTLYIFKHLNITSSSQIIKIYYQKEISCVDQATICSCNISKFTNYLWFFHSLSQREKSTALSSCEKKSKRQIVALQQQNSTINHLSYKVFWLKSPDISASRKYWTQMTFLSQI